MVGVAIVAFLHCLTEVRVDADEDELTVVNILRRRRLKWSEVLAVRLPPAEPWLIIDLSGGTSLAVKACHVAATHSISGETDVAISMVPKSPTTRKTPSSTANSSIDP